MASRLPVGTWILCFVVVCGVAGSAHAVDRLVPQEYPTIQEGINAAQTGDIVLVSPGVYNELIDFLGKTITVRSTDGPAVTIIDGGGSGPIVTFQNLEGPGSVLEGFTITNGVAAEGAGITILDAYPTILNNTISSNTATTGPGGGILMRNYTPNIDVSLIPQIAGNIISSNVALTSAGGGLYAYSGYDFPQLSGNTWSENLGVLASTLFVTSGSVENTGIQLQGEHITSSYGQTAPNSDSISTIDIQNVNLDIADSEVLIHNSIGWNGGLSTWNEQTKFTDTTLRMFGNETSTSNQTILADIDTSELLIHNLTLKNESTTDLARFDTYLYTPPNSFNPTIQSNGLFSEGVFPDFYIGYSAGGNIQLENTTLISAPLEVNAYNYYGGDVDITIKNLEVSGNFQGNYSRLINVVQSSYNGLTNADIDISNVNIQDGSIPDQMTSILRVSGWGGSSNWNLSMKDILIDNTTHSGNNPLDLIDINFPEAYYGSASNKASLSNLLLVSPSTATTAIRLDQDDYGSYYGNTLDSRISLSNMTLAGDFSTSGTIVAEGYSYDYYSTDLVEVDISIKNSIIEGESPLENSSSVFSSTDITVDDSLSTVPLSVPGEGNTTGLASFVSGPHGDHYLSQISAGNLVDSLGVNAADPNSSAPFLGGTRSDGGLDTGAPDIGFHYSTRSEISSVNLELDDAAIFFEPGTGLIDSDVISLYLSENLQPGFSPGQFRGLSLRLLQEPNYLRVNAASLAPEFLTVLGTEPDYFEALVCNDVVTIGMIPSLSDPSLTFTVSPTLEVLQFRIAAGTELANSNEVVETQFIPQDGPNCAGTLEVNNLVTDSLGNTTSLNRQPVRLTLVPHSQFRRGDANADGNTDLGDAVALLSFLFNGYDELTCEDASDSNDDGVIDVADPVFLLAALFTGGSAPAEPGEICGSDPTEDLLRCANFPICTPTVELNSISYFPNENKELGISWLATGPVDHYQLAIDGIVHQRLGGEATETLLSFEENGLKNVCHWTLSEGALIETCQQIFSGSPVADLICGYDPTGTLAVFQWMPVPEIEQLEIYSEGQLVTVVESDAGFTSIPLPNQKTQYCFIGRTDDLLSLSECCFINPGDDCPTATPVSEGTFPVDNSEVLDNPRYDCDTNLTGDLWFRYTPTATANAIITTCNVPSATLTDTTLIVYDASLGCPDINSPCLASADDTCDSGQSGNSFSSQILIPVIAGDEYLIQVGGWNGSTGQTELSISIAEAEICDDGIDNDGDLVIDCLDQDCGGTDYCGTEICDDGIDNDSDTIVDCFDPNCVTDPFCIEGDDASCSDGIDNDVDGLIDCFDQDCGGTASCGTEICDDGIDNDSDTITDCLDPNCDTDPFCFEGDTASCSDGIDNDADGLIDCFDPDCTNTASCPLASNDTCVNAELVEEGSFPWDNIVSTTAGPIDCDSNMANDIWFLYTATNNGTALIQTCNGGGNNADTVLIVYDATLGCPTTGSACLASGDDQCVNEANGPAFMSSTEVPVVAGESYYIQVGGWNGTLGTGVLDISTSP